MSAYKSLGQELNRAEIAISDTKIVVMRTVLINETQWIEMRKWIKWHQDGQFHPTANGLFIESEMMANRVIPKFLELAGHNSSHNESDSSTVE